MFTETGAGLTGGGAAAIGTRAFAPPHRTRAPARFDLVVDLGQRIGSREWWRGLATCTALCAAALSLTPRFHVWAGAVPAPLSEAQESELRAQAIAPQAYGADSGRRVMPTALVEHLSDTPERPRIELSATLGQGDGFARVLERAGVSSAEAEQVARLVAPDVSLAEIRPGTRLDLVLGRRPNKQVARPLEHLAFRAKLELSLEADRVGDALRLKRIPIAVDETPLRLEGRVGQSLFAAARAAGAPALAIQTYLRAMAQHVPVDRIRADDRFDLVLAHRRAATGETETGGLLYAGLTEGRKILRLLKWTVGGKEQWYDAAGVGESHGQMKMPVAGHLTSSFGMRFHPILGFSRMHQGVDFGAPMGSPIAAAADGTVSYAGFHGGHGNFVQIRHGGDMGSGYAHMSRFIVRVGQHVSAGQVIGYVGSTGLSTGPHLHFEVYRNNAAVNPLSVKFTQAAQLAGAELGRFKATLARLMAVRRN
jgi:murein DD-endopeptidase MepM/ murein hydrolase activator NlpD